jgi:hypothetical protein
MEKNVLDVCLPPNIHDFWEGVMKRNNAKALQMCKKMVLPVHKTSTPVNTYFNATITIKKYKRLPIEMYGTKREHIYGVYVYLKNLFYLRFFAEVETNIANEMPLDMAIKRFMNKHRITEDSWKMDTAIKTFQRYRAKKDYMPFL